METASAAPFVPDTASVTELAAAARGCRGCHLHQDATQTVFGAGPRTARMMLVGEQPGDQEDKAGEPFVGPAGRILDKALDAAGIGRDDLYVTNAVKHFKFTVRTERGKRRIHQTPSRTEVVACRPWLLAELDAVHPDVVVLMGAVAAKSLLGNDFRLTAHRGELLRLATDDGERNQELVVTVHPSSILRGPPERRDEALNGLVEDLRFASEMLDVAPARRHA
ncbi:MAG: uracil-DNA glycosylase [Mycobacterium sp.]|nr:uracil-DNA glycosylase [Mycobacterium sp.]